MNATKRFIITTAAILGLVATNSPAQATTLNFLEDWVLNIANAGESLTGAVIGVDQVTFKGITHVSVNDLDQNGYASVYDTFKVDGLLYATGFTGGGSALNSEGLNNTGTGQGYEFTTKFSIDGLFTSVNPTNGTLNFSHPSIGVLDLYIDNLKDTTGVQANTISALGFKDGTNVANFSAVPNAPGTGGVFDPSVIDGSDDAFFTLVNQLAGVFQKPLGTNLDDTLAGIWTRSNFSAQQLTTIPNATNWELEFGVGSAGNDGLLNFFVDENADARVVTPEPGTLALLGVGLFGLAIFGKRRMSNK